MEVPTKLVLLLSFHFLILFTAFAAFQSIITKIHEDQGDRSLGPFRFSIYYFAFMVANFFVPKVRYSNKWLITFSTLTYVINYLTGFFMAGTPVYVKYLLAAFGAILNGVGASFIWTCAGSYIHYVCQKYDKLDVKGHYFGIFNTIYCTSNVLGGLIVTFGLSYLTHQEYFILISGVAFISFLYGIFCIEDLKQRLQYAKQINILIEAKEAFISTSKFYPLMKYILGMIFLDGANMSFKASTLLHLVPLGPDEKQNSLNVGICVIMCGLGSVVGGFLGGKLCDKIGIKVCCRISLIFFYILTSFLILLSQYESMIGIRIICLFWGLQIEFITGILFVVASKIYKGKKEAFAVTKQFNCISFVGYQIVAMSTKNSIPVLYIACFMLLVALPAIWGVWKLFKKYKEEQRIQDKSILSSESVGQKKILEEQQTMSSNLINQQGNNNQ